jgi:outer membrane receptor protein involved in Fe transport
VELEYDHLSPYHTHSDNGADPMGKYQRPDLYHLRVSYGFEGWSLWAHALNLFDKEYANRVSYSAPSRRSTGGRKYTSGSGRTLYAGVSYEWK